MTRPAPIPTNHHAARSGASFESKYARKVASRARDFDDGMMADRYTIDMSVLCAIVRV